MAQEPIQYAYEDLVRGLHLAEEEDDRLVPHEIDFTSENEPIQGTKRRRVQLPTLNRLNYKTEENINIIEAGICGIKSTDYFMEVYQNLDPSETIESNISNYFKHKHGFEQVLFVYDQENEQAIKITLSENVAIFNLPVNLNKISTILGLFPANAIYITFDINDVIMDEKPSKSTVSTAAFTFILIMYMEDVILARRSVAGLIPLKKLFIWPKKLGKKNISTKFVT